MNRMPVYLGILAAAVIFNNWTNHKQWAHIGALEQRVQDEPLTHEDHIDLVYEAERQIGGMPNQFVRLGGYDFRTDANGCIEVNLNNWWHPTSTHSFGECGGCGTDTSCDWIAPPPPR